MSGVDRTSPRVGRELVPLLDAQTADLRQDPALDAPMLPEPAAAAAAAGSCSRASAPTLSEGG